MITLLKRLIQIFKIPSVIFYASLLFIHFIIKDRFHFISFMFYICPLPLIIIFGLILCLLYYKNKGLRYGLLTTLLGTTIYFCFHYFGSVNGNVTSAPISHILFWNASKNQPLTKPFLLEHIKQSDPEIIGLVEAEDVSDEDMKIFKQTFPKYEFRILEGGMLVGVKGTIESIWYRSLNLVCNFNYISATIDNKQRYIMISDVFAMPQLPRELPLGIIYNFAKEHPVDVIMGDFNTPYESAFFGPFKTDFKSFHHYSLGMTSTWPIPIPLIEIDNIWLNTKYNPIQLEKFCSDLSRHKLLIAEYQ